MIEVDDGHGQGTPVAFRLADLVVQDRGERAAVRQPRQGIAPRGLAIGENGNASEVEQDRTGESEEDPDERQDVLRPDERSRELVHPDAEEQVLRHGLQGDRLPVELPVVAPTTRIERGSLRWLSGMPRRDRHQTVESLAPPDVLEALSGPCEQNAEAVVLEEPGAIA
ncbi:MAG: hypothetical protein H6834_16185 [Planctomycetes bacterium]|nr:hypothetical protein [Planctomycetota bacterium]